MLDQLSILSKNLLKSFINIFFIRLLGLILAFLSQLILAKILGVSQFGLYSVMLSIIAIMVAFTLLGFDHSLKKIVPEYVEKDERENLKSLISTSFSLVMIISIIISIFAILYFYFSSNIDFYYYVVCFLAFPFFITMHFLMNVLHSLKEYTKADIILNILFPVGLILIFLAFNSFIYKPSILEIFYFRFALSLGLSIWIFKQIRKNIYVQLFDRFNKGNLQKWLNLSIPLMLNSFFQLIILRSGVVMAGLLINNSSAGIYAVALMISDLCLLGINSVSMVLVPQISGLFQKNKINELQNLVTLSVRSMFFSTLIIILILYFFGLNILNLFGVDFLAAKPILDTLILAHLVSAIFGPAGYLLNMTNNHIVFLKLIFLASILNIILNYIFISILDIEGLAFSYILTNFFLSSAATFYVIKLLKINPTILKIN